MYREISSHPPVPPSSPSLSPENRNEIQSLPLALTVSAALFLGADLQRDRWFLDRCTLNKRLQCHECIFLLRSLFAFDCTLDELLLSQDYNLCASYCTLITSALMLIVSVLNVLPHCTH